MPGLAGNLWAGRCYGFPTTGISQPPPPQTQHRHHRHVAWTGVIVFFHQGVSGLDVQAGIWMMFCIKYIFACLFSHSQNTICNTIYNTSLNMFALQSSPTLCIKHQLQGRHAVAMHVKPRTHVVSSATVKFVGSGGEEIAVACAEVGIVLIAVVFVFVHGCQVTHVYAPLSGSIHSRRWSRCRVGAAIHMPGRYLWVGWWLLLFAHTYVVEFPSSRFVSFPGHAWAK